MGVVGQSMPQGQIPFDLPVASALERDDLFVTSANALAVELIDSWPQWPGSLVVLAGPAGSGKTHLAGVWSKASGAGITEMSALDATFPPANNYLVIENARAGAIREAALFHILNHVRAEGGHCLITSREWPSAWGVTLPDLNSRLRAAQMVELAEPDDALLSAVLVKLFADRQIAAPRTLINWLLARMERSLDAARILVAEMDREAMARGTKISRAIAAQALGRTGMGGQ